MLFILHYYITVVILGKKRHFCDVINILFKQTKKFLPVVLDEKNTRKNDQNQRKKCT